MQRSCSACKTSFLIHPDEQAFLAKMQFSFGERSFTCPESTLCPDCRLQIRTCHRNERFLHKTYSALSGKEMISLYAESPPWGAPYNVYTPDEWQSDRWDPLSYGKPCNFSRGFFEQFAELHKAVPRLGLVVLSNENSDYVTSTAYSKNCYLINSSEYCEDCLYGKLLQSCRNAVDCHYLYNSELCYECFSAFRCYGCTHLSFSKNCHDCHFSSNLTNCTNCCFCKNLSGKEYCFENQPIGKEEYARRLQDLFGSHRAQEEGKRRLHALRSKSIHRYANIVNCENCTGDYIENSKNCLECYDVTESEDCRYVTAGVKVKDNMDCSNMYLNCELCLNSLGTLEVHNTAYCLFIFYSQNMLYSEQCFNCHDCFGCNGLKQKHHCILNTQYSKEAYEDLVPKIIGHMQKTGEWGNYFPPSMAPFSYHETLANEYFPSKKDEVRSQGFLWHDLPDETPHVQKVIQASALPDRIEDIPDDVLEWALECAVTGRPYRIQKSELHFYRTMQLPLPHKHPDVRYDERMALRNPRKLFTRECAKCGKEIETTYSPEQPEVVYCEECYLQVVY